MKRYPAIIAYDIVSNKRRRKVFRCLQAWSLDNQYSLFECQLAQSEAEELFLQLAALIEDEDSLLLAWLDKRRKAVSLSAAGRIGFQVPACYVA